MGNSQDYEKVPTSKQITSEKCPNQCTVYFPNKQLSVDASQLTKVSKFIKKIGDSSQEGCLTYITSDEYDYSLSLCHPEYEKFYNTVEVNRFYIISSYNRTIVSIEPDQTFVVGKVKSVIKLKDTDIQNAEAKDNYNEIIFETHPARHHSLNYVLRLLIHDNHIDRLQSLKGLNVKFSAYRFSGGRYIVSSFEELK